VSTGSGSIASPTSLKGTQL